ncbi:MAG: AlkZ family DNA glycosylase [Nitrospirae bacterium]|nr:AlkZ family DNA glycosylase [Nitrospirota bacterium]
MTVQDITRFRLYNQQISSARFKKPGEVVKSLGAMQAQDYPGTLWAIGLRLPNATITNIEQAIVDGSIIRTWPMRGTLHFVAAADIRWMLELLSPRIIESSASRFRELELDERTFTRCKNVFEKALAGGKQLTRAEMYEALEHDGIAVDKQRGYHILRRAGQDRLICFGLPRSRQDTFRLLDEYCPTTKILARDEAVCELTKRYFVSHGPATLEDFVWWSGLKVSDAKAGLEEAKTWLTQESVDGNVYWMAMNMPVFRHDPKAVYLLPGFDEYMLGYKDRSAALDPRHVQKICPGNNGMFAPTVIMDGRVVGTWKRIIKKSVISIKVDFFGRQAKNSDALVDAAERYGKFLGMSVEMPVFDAVSEAMPITSAGHKTVEG